MPLAAPTVTPRFFEDVRVATAAEDGAVRVEWLPDGRTRLVFRVLDEGRIADLSVAGPRTRALFKQAPGVVRAVLVSLKPGWSMAVLGVPAHVLTERTVRLESIWGDAGRELCDELVTTPRVSDVLDRLAYALAVRAQENFEPSSARLARHAARLLEGGELRVNSVAERLGVTARHLRRVFTESIGVAPKEFSRAARLQRAVRAAATSNDWGQIAAGAGYYDQAHLIADFRELVGLTPCAYQRREARQDTRCGASTSAAA
jgi:AraC-like DNA-binding protein